MNPEPVLVSDRPHAVEPLDAENNQLQVVGLTKIYRSNKSAVIAFEDLEFSLSLGEIGVVLGPSGCGKSSLLRCMAGLEPATQGTVRVDSNRYLPDRPELLENELSRLKAEAARLASTPLDPSSAYSAAVMELRLQTAELALRAAQSALLHSGARGFVSTSAPQRRAREAMFFSILTPSIKHLRKELAA